MHNARVACMLITCFRWSWFVVHNVAGHFLLQLIDYSVSPKRRTLTSCPLWLCQKLILTLLLKHAGGKASHAPSLLIFLGNIIVIAGQTNPIRRQVVPGFHSISLSWCCSRSFSAYPTGFFSSFFQSFNRQLTLGWYISSFLEVHLLRTLKRHCEGFFFPSVSLVTEKAPSWSLNRSDWIPKLSYPSFSVDPVVTIQSQLSIQNPCDMPWNTRWFIGILTTAYEIFPM